MADAPAPARVVPATEGNPVLSLQVGVVVVAALYFGREVLIPITLAVLLSFILAPAVALLRRVRVPRVPAVLLAVVVALGIIVGFGTVIGSQVAQLAGNIPAYAGTVEKKIESVRSYTVGRVADLAARVGRQAPQAQAPAAGAPPPAATPAPAAAPTASPLELAQKYLSTVLSPLGTLFVVLVVAIFILLQQEDLRDRLIRLFGASDLHRTTTAIDDAGARLGRYFLTQLAVNATFGAVIGVGLYFIGVPNPVLWALLSALLRFVPYIGSFISAGLPIALAAAVDPGWSMVIWTAVYYLVVELLVSQAVEPLLYGHSTGLSPFAVVVSALFWSWIWGPVGLILSMPLTLCLVVLGRYVQRLAFLDVLLGDRPALTPTESFYQRILAGDSDEAQDQAEVLLRSHALSAYYDEVALKGLQMAANDAARGALPEANLELVKRTITGLVSELDRHADEEPDPAKVKEDEGTAGTSDGKPAVESGLMPPRIDTAAAAWAGPGAVLCLAGKGPLDEAASAMLAQLLQKHGLGARVAAHQMASRDAIGGLDVSGVAMVCVSYLDIAGSPSHLRFLIQRLHRRLPGVPVLVGLWPAEDAVLREDRVRAVIGAEYYATSLREAVGFCVGEAQKAAAPGREAMPA